MQTHVLKMQVGIPQRFLLLAPRVAGRKKIWMLLGKAVERNAMTSHQRPGLAIRGKGEDMEELPGRG